MKDLSSKHFSYNSKKNSRVKVELLGRQKVKWVWPETIVGYCHCNLHLGYLTNSHFKEHNCVLKQCKHFEKFEDFPYWDQNKSKSELRREGKLSRKYEEIIKQEDDLRLIRMVTQAIKELNIPIVVTSVVPKQGTRSVYFVYYVSPDARNDQYQYKNLTDLLYEKYNRYFVLKHIKGPDGRYSTVYDWNQAQKRKWEKPSNIIY